MGTVYNVQYNGKTLPLSYMQLLKGKHIGIFFNMVLNE